MSKKVKAALEALSEDERIDLLKELGFIKKKLPKSKGPSKRELFKNAAQHFINNILDDLQAKLAECSFPGPFSITIGENAEGKPFHEVKRTRKKYGPRKKK